MKSNSLQLETSSGYPGIYKVINENENENENENRRGELDESFRCRAVELCAQASVKFIEIRSENAHNELITRHRRRAAICWAEKYPGSQGMHTKDGKSSKYQKDPSPYQACSIFVTPPMFCELEVLVRNESNLEWKESARWIKFEENVEEGGNRWSKPFVGTLSLNTISQLKALLLNGTIKLRMDAHSWEAITNIICQNFVNNGTLPIEKRDKLRHVLLRPHRRQYELNAMSRSRRGANTDSSTNGEIALNASKLATDTSNKRFMRKIPAGAEASNILVGEVSFLDKPLSVFLRLKEANVLGTVTEVPVPTRFIYLFLGPKQSEFSYQEVGRAMATLLSDDIFREHAYQAQKPEHLLTAMDDFLKASIVLPPGVWDPSIRIEPPPILPTQERRKRAPNIPDKPDKIPDLASHDQHARAESGLVRTGRLFGGLVNDIKRKTPWYWSDFSDSLNMQCVASWIFLYFACLSPIITFGGLLSEATGKNIAAIESLVSGFICGIGYGLFSGQPLTLLGSTGPVLVFETIVYEFCQKQGWDYLTFRFWIGAWIAVILLLLTAFDASASVCYITRFTEENFAALIAFIFIYKAIENVISIHEKFPLHNSMHECICVPPDDSNATLVQFAKYDGPYCLRQNGTLVGKDCDKPDTANVFLMSVILFLGTYAISVILKEFKNALFFPTFVRQFISDFAVIIAIFVMTILDYSMQVATPKLEVPHELKPTLATRGWLIPPFHEQNPSWSPFVAIIPALLGTILIFMDQQITAVIINRKENKLKKGCGYHLDLFILSILIAICSVMGLPWFVAATVLSLNHVNSLKKESECTAPGEKPQFLGIREQRMTQILIFLTMGLSVVLTPLLGNIPMPVLFGVFLYMGVSSLKGLQILDRLLIIFMPAKYQPDYEYLRQVPIRRVHLFTMIQLACLIALWIIKSFSQTSILFPIMLVVMIGIRKALDYVFTQRELGILDDIMPGMIQSQPNELSNGNPAVSQWKAFDGLPLTVL